MDKQRQKAVQAAADQHTEFFGKMYHWAKSKQGNLVKHPGMANKCRRHHYK